MQNNTNNQTKDTAEYNRLVNKKAAKQAEKQACQKRIDNYDYLLRRLRPARDTVSELKSTFRTIKKEDKEIAEGKYKWSGQQYSKFKQKGNNIKSEDTYYCDNTLDHVLDSLNNEITRIENEKLKEVRLIGDLAAAINSISNSIRNFFN